MYLHSTTSLASWLPCAATMTYQCQERLDIHIASSLYSTSDMYEDIINCGITTAYQNDVKLDSKSNSYTQGIYMNFGIITQYLKKSQLNVPFTVMTHSAAYQDLEWCTAFYI